MARACVVFSPAAGNAVAAPVLEQRLRPLIAAGWQVQLVEANDPGEASRLAREAVQAGAEMVVAAGGDGTLNEVLQPLVGTKVILGVLPLGTVNVWARQVAIPTDLPGAVRVLLEGRVRQVDVGQAGQRFFLLMAGIGFDAEVTRHIRPQAKRRLGILAYIVAGVAVALSYVGRRVELNADGVRRGYRALLVVIGNSRRYGGPVNVTTQARLDDGLLDVCVFKGTGPLRAAWHVFLVLLGRHVHDPGVDYFQARRLTVSADSPLPVQVDGDTMGETPMAFQVRPRGLNVLLPTGVSADLFAEQPAEPTSTTVRGGR